MRRFDDYLGLAIKTFLVGAAILFVLLPMVAYGDSGTIEADHQTAKPRGTYEPRHSIDAIEPTDLGDKARAVPVDLDEFLAARAAAVEARKAAVQADHGVHGPAKAVKAQHGTVGR